MAERRPAGGFLHTAGRTRALTAGRAGLGFRESAQIRSSHETSGPTRPGATVASQSCAPASPRHHHPSPPPCPPPGTPPGSDSELELDVLAPDAPLAGPAPTQPRWLARSAPRRCSVARLAAAALALYALARLLRGLPLLADPLPAYSGPYAVGALDVELPLPRPRPVVAAGPVLPADARRPAFVLESVLFTVYYPVDPARRPPRPRTYPWIDRPLAATAAGYARLARLDAAPVRAVLTLALWAVAGALRIPAAVDAPLLQAGAPLPVVVFSHGMAASRTDYMHFVGELASRGLVAAVEHRDGSCPGSLVKRPGAPDRRVVHFAARHLDPPPDTPALKCAQLAFRDAELLETVRVLRAMDAGDAAANARAPEDAAPDDAAPWRGRLVLAGHSYGATGALQALDAGAIALDPGKESGPLNARVAVLLLAVHSDAWSRRRSLLHGRPHFDTVHDLAAAAAAGARAAWFLTSLGTAHPSLSDAPLIQPLLMRWATGASRDPKAALRDYVAVSAAFVDFLATRNASGLLVEPVTHREYGEWVSEDRRRRFPDHLARLWEVHVSPASQKQSSPASEKQ